MQQRFVTALSACDKSTTYTGLISAFRTHVLPVLIDVVRTPLATPLDDVTSPSVCCPDATAIRDYLCSLPSADDVWILLLQHASSLLRPQKRGRSSDLSTSELIQAFVLFYGRGLPAAGEMKLRWEFLSTERVKMEKSPQFVNSNAAERRKLQLGTVLSVFSEKAHRHNFTLFWTKFLNADAPSALHLHLLNRLSTDILPHLTNPLIVSDYLTSCFGCGGLISVLALRGTMLLMLDHGLEQPKFYEQLYSLLTPDAFSSRHRFQLFELVDLCMKSLKVPSYIAAAFAKRVARIALLSPAPTLYFSLPFLRQLLQRHPNCLCLIHRTSTSMLGETLEVSVAAQQRANKLIEQLFEGVDPFQSSVKDPWKADALYSSLWELTLLEKQFLPAVPLMVSAFASPVEDNTPLRFEKTYGRLFTAEVTKEVTATKPPPVSFVAPRYDAESTTNIVIV